MIASTTRQTNGFLRALLLVATYCLASIAAAAITVLLLALLA